MALIRAGLVACISQQRDIEVVAELDRREPVLPTVSSLRPDVAVIDDGIACHDGFAVIQALHAITPSCHTLIMADRPHLGDLRKAVAAHAAGFMLKGTSPENISEAIRQVVLPPCAGRSRHLASPSSVAGPPNTRRLRASRTSRDNRWASAITTRRPSSVIR